MRGAHALRRHGLPRRLSPTVPHPNDDAKWANAPFVVVTGHLPGARGHDGTTVGDPGLPDDPVTTALEQLASQLDGAWVGLGPHPTPRVGRVPLRALELPHDVEKNYDSGHARASLWPVYHSLVKPARYDPSWWRAYLRVNTLLAAAAAARAGLGATVLVHDYRLQLVPALLRTLRRDLRIGFSLHVPFPDPGLFRQMPRHEDTLHGLLGADHIGFQTARSAENFLRVAQDRGDHGPTVGVHPTSVDTSQIAEKAASIAVIEQSRQLRHRLGDPGALILSISTADESQGIEQRLRQYEQLFRAGSLQPGDVAIVQIITGWHPADVSLVDRIARQAARINGLFATVGRPCVHLVVDSPDLTERVILYQAADLLVATPLQEATTTVALEFVAACRSDAAIVLSEFSGTAAALPEAVIVNPHDHEAVRAAVTASLHTPVEERVTRMSAMRAYPAAYDTHAWALTLLGAMHADPPHTPAGPLSLDNETRWPDQSARPSTRDSRWIHDGPHEDEP